MFGYLSVEGDPTAWVLAQPVDASPLSRDGETVSIAVTAPLAGTLLLSRKAAGSVAVFNLGDSGEVIPSEGMELEIPVLYLPSPKGYTPSAEGPAGTLPYYELPPATSLTTLGSNIAAAMRAGSALTIDYGSPVAGGVLWLNAATVPFVVLCPATPAPGAAPELLLHSVVRGMSDPRLRVGS
jgi:hypothetical protein